MDTKTLLVGIASFIAGGLLVATAAVTFEKKNVTPGVADTTANNRSVSMMADLPQSKGDAFDRAFLQAMIVHHEGAIQMAGQAQKYAAHQEVRDLADGIITAQRDEIARMRQWQADWGYGRQNSDTGNGHMMDMP